MVVRGPFGEADDVALTIDQATPRGLPGGRETLSATITGIVTAVVP